MQVKLEHLAAQTYSELLNTPLRRLHDAEVVSEKLAQEVIA